MGTVYQICVSGAAKGESVTDGKKMAEALGVALAKSGHSLLTGATTGLPEHAATAYKKHKGNSSLGISPASTKVEHVLKYRLPLEPYDTVIYSGLNYVGRDTFLVMSSDAVLCIGGRLGTLHEFTVAMETKTPVGILEGTLGVSSEIRNLLEILPNAHPNLLVFDKDPEALVAKLTRLLDKVNRPYRDIYKG